MEHTVHMHTIYAVTSVKQAAHHCAAYDDSHRSNESNITQYNTVTRF